MSGMKGGYGEAKYKLGLMGDHDLQCNMSQAGNETPGKNYSCLSGPEYNYTGGEDYPNPFNIPHIRAIFIVLYTLVFICCFLGNVLVIIVILKHRRMRTITNFFLANLAVADFCVGAFCVLPNLGIQLSPEWILGQVACKLFYFVQAMSYTASITILTVISIERYFAIIYPIRSKQLTTINLLRITVIIIWIIAAASGVPFLVIYDTVKIGVVYYCIPVFNVNMKALVTINFILWYTLPLALMTVMYSRISIVLWESSRCDHGKDVGGFRASSNMHCLLKEKVKASRKKALIKGKRFVAIESDETSSAAETGRPRVFPSRNLMIEAGKPGEVVNEEKNLMDNVDYSSQCESSSQGAAVSSGIKSLDDSLSDENEDYEDYEDDWPSHERFPNQIKLKLLNKCRNGSQKFPLQMNESDISSSCNSTSVDQPKSAMKKICSKKPRLKERKQDNKALLARRRVIRLLLAVICFFAICVLPYHLRILWQNWSHLQPTPSTALISPITFVIYYMNSGLNPLLYAFLSDRFRGSLVEVLTCRDRRKSQPQMSFTTKTLNSTI